MRTISTEEFVARIKAGKVKSVLPMIAEKARATWHNLPDSEKTVHSIDDLIQDGINHTVTHVAYRFDLSRAKQGKTQAFTPGTKQQGTKFTTYLCSSLDNYYADVLRKVYTDKRLIAHGVYSLDTGFGGTITGANGNIRNITLGERYAYSKKSSNNEDKIINRIDAERAFVKAYAHASPLLRRYLIKWLLQPRISRNKKGTEFNSARTEFRKKAKPYLQPHLCETIQSDYICRANIASTVSSTFQTKKKNRDSFLYTEEFEMLPILSQPQILQLIPTIG